MKIVNTVEAVGLILCQDITEIVPGVRKGPAFRKGHKVVAEDIPKLLSLGKEHLYVLEEEPGMIHENEAALRLFSAVAGQNLKATPVTEGRIDFIAEIQGLLQIKVDLLRQINAQGQIALATLHTNQAVKQGQKVAGTRVIPLMVKEDVVLEVENLKSKVIEILPYRSLKVGVVSTGNEIKLGRIQDAFGPVMRQKFSELGCEIIGQTFPGDDSTAIANDIQNFQKQGAEFIVVTGGMSVDPDDCTPKGIRESGASVISYGAPVFPGAMFLLAYLKTEQAEIPVLGLPGCVMYVRASIFDLIVPRLLAGQKVVASDIQNLGHGGFCLGCAECHYPICHFGKA